MTDKVQKIHEEVERLRIKNTEAFDCGCDGTKCAGYDMACDDILSFIDSMQEEPTGSITSKQADKLIEQSKEIRKQLTKDKLNSMLNNALSKETKESLNEWLDKKNFRERYKRITQSEQFKKTHEGMSIGEVIPIEDEEPASKVWHDARETPESDKTILLIAPNGNSSLALWDGKELKSCTLGGGHSVLCSNDEWAYISDILKL